MMRILITGANGQLGQEMRRVAARATDGDTYFFTDVAELDICDKDAVEAFVTDNKVTAIVNCAAYTNVNGAENNEVLCDRLNREAPGFLADIAEKHDCKFVHISTDYVFDGRHFLPYKENEKPCPNSVYGRTKLAGEQAVLAACPTAIIIRTAWLYSVFGNNFVKTMIRLGKEKEELGVVFDQIGTPTCAKDLASAIDCILHAKQWVPGVYHYTNEGVCSWYDFTLSIHACAGITQCQVKPLHTDEYPTPAARPYYSVLDKTKIKKTFGINVPHWAVSLQQCVQEILAQEL